MALHDSRPRKVVSLNNNNQNFIIKRNQSNTTTTTQLNPNTQSFSASSIPNTSRLSASINNGHPIKAKIKLSPAINRPSASPSPSTGSVPHITRPSAASHKYSSTSSVITARVVKSSKALHQISSRPNSPFRPISHAKDIVLSPHVTQRPSPSRSRANTHSDRCPSQLDSDCFSSASSTSANADGGSELSRTHPLGLSTRSKSVQTSHLSSSNLDFNHLTTYTPHGFDHHHQPLKAPDEKPFKASTNQSRSPSLTHKPTHSLISNITSSEVSHSSPSLASPVNIINRHTISEIPRTRDLPSDSTAASSPSQRPTSNDSSSNSKTGFNETWTQPAHSTTDGEPSTSSMPAPVDPKQTVEEDWEILNDKEMIGEEANGEGAVSEQVPEVVEEVEEVREDEARVNRKILDLEISNSSLLAINARLERTKLKQASEIRELRKKMRERSLVPSLRAYPTDDGQSSLHSGPEESDAENISQESLKIESLMKEDEKFSDVMRVLENLIGRAREALEYQPGEKELMNKRVLNRVEIGVEEEEENEMDVGDLSRSVSINQELGQIEETIGTDGMAGDHDSKNDPPIKPLAQQQHITTTNLTRQTRSPSPFKPHNHNQTDPKHLNRINQKPNIKIFH